MIAWNCLINCTFEKQAYGFFILMRLAQPATIISVHKDEGQQPNILGWNKNMSDKGEKP